MPNKLAHFAIEAANVSRAKTFYETVFGWRFVPWGPPDFYQIEGAGVHGALQQRRNPDADPVAGMELTFAVTDLEASAASIEAAGGQVVSEPFTIPGVGRLIQFTDTEGNPAIVMQYEPEHARDMGLT